MTDRRDDPAVAVEPVPDAPAPAPAPSRGPGASWVAPVEPATSSGEPQRDGFVREARPGKQRSLWRELPVLIVVAVALALLIKTFFLQAFFIPSGSMEHTLAVGDRVLVNKLVYDFRDPHRGEIVVFNGRGTQFPNEVTIPEPSNIVARGLRNVQSFLGLGSFDESDFIKRVIAVGGDTIACPATPEDPSHCRNVLVNGKAIDEADYLFEDRGYTAPFQETFEQRTVPKGQLFVMGDHRDDSGDSRPHGTIPVANVIGRAFVTVFPVQNFAGHPVPATFDKQPLAPSAERPPLTLRVAGSAALPPAAGLLLGVPVVAGRRRLARRRLRRADTGGAAVR